MTSRRKLDAIATGMIRAAAARAGDSELGERYIDHARMTGQLGPEVEEKEQLRKRFRERALRAGDPGPGHILSPVGRRATKTPKLSKPQQDVLVRLLHPPPGARAWRVNTLMDAEMVGAPTVNALVRRGLVQLDVPNGDRAARIVFTTAHLTDAGRAIAQPLFDASPAGRRVANFTREPDDEDDEQAKCARCRAPVPRDGESACERCGYDPMSCGCGKRSCTRCTP